MKTKEFIKKNEEDANKNVARAMFITLCLFTLVFILDMVGIFIIPKKVMAVAYAVSFILLISPLVFNKVIGASNQVLKYFYVLFSAIFISILTMLMTYHAYVIYAYPIVIAGIYFSKKITHYSIVITAFFTIVAQVLGFKFQFLTDANFPTFTELIVFSVIPKTLCLLGFAAFFNVLTKRTTSLLKIQQDNADQYISLSDDMISGFATLVENRDENTGMHIKRTGLYVDLLAKKLQTMEKYKDLIDDEFIENLTKAAPMHDVGKISVPDAILQKPGPLTKEEYEIMKTHSSKGGIIIHQTFAHVGDEMYRKMAYEVVRYHHEKWNGKGYPEGLKEESIPLAARIMSVADVFDAISQQRCYRVAMPIDQCFQIIQDGSGKDFEPDIVTAFMELRPQVEKICMEFRDE